MPFERKKKYILYLNVTIYSFNICGDISCYLVC